MTYADILAHCEREIRNLEAFTRSERFKNLYEEHKMVKELIERTEAKGHCGYTDGVLIDGIDDFLYKPDCLEKHESDDFFNWNQIRHFKFCPYCGRKIEVIDE